MTQYSTNTSAQAAVTQHKNIRELTVSDASFENFRKMIYDSCGYIFRIIKNICLKAGCLKE